MKLATLYNHTRDGELVVVNKALTKAVKAFDVAPTLQFALDNWAKVSPTLLALYDDINRDRGDWFPFKAAEMMSPLPRAYQWADGSAYVNHVELVRKARGVELPESFWTDPLMYQGGSDKFLRPEEDIRAQVEWGIDFEAEIAVVTGDVAMGTAPDAAGKKIHLLMLVNDVSLRNLIPNEIAKGFGFFQSKPASTFSPVAVTPDELGTAWDGHKVHLPLITHLNDREFGRPNAGVDMTFDFPALIAHAAKTRDLAAGTIIGSGTVSNKDRSIGSSCLAEARMLEILEHGKPNTPFMQNGDRVRIEMFDQQGNSIFGAINQKVVA